MTSCIINITFQLRKGTNVSMLFHVHAFFNSRRVVSTNFGKCNKINEMFHSRDNHSRIIISPLSKKPHEIRSRYETSFFPNPKEKMQHFLVSRVFWGTSSPDITRPSLPQTDVSDHVVHVWRPEFRRWFLVSFGGNSCDSFRLQSFIFGGGWEYP